MEKAESSVNVGIAPEEAHKKWLEWTGEGGPGMPKGESTEVSGQQVGTALKDGEKGMCYFEPGEGGGTMVRMELRYNPEVVKNEGLEADWVQRRVHLYLTRFKNFAEGRAA
jgi:hypothetical protein